ncbi:MAG TPA: POTRA domain-containing protein [Moraxellaceae bacterium]|nr:POTRA domain-containing protein [Moraxellaceae bacterium]
MENNSLLKPAMAVFFLGVSSLATAATPPDAGQTLQQLQSAPPPAAPAKPAPVLINGSTTAEPHQAETVEKIHVNHVVFRGNTAFSSEQLSRIAHVESADVSIQDLRAAAHRVSQFYRDQGFLVARAYLPAQDIVGGVVTIAVLEGKLDRIEVNNASDVSSERVRRVVASQMPGQAPVNTAGANRALLLLQQTPGIGAVQGSLHPGAEVGTTAMTVDVKSAPLVSGNIAADNYGSSFTGKNRLSGNLVVSNMLSRADQLTFQGIVTDRDALDSGRIAWDFPVAYDGIRVGAAVSHTGYEVGKQFTALDTHGSARTTALYGNYPMVLTPTAQVNGNVSVEWRDLVDTTGALSFSDRKAIMATVLTLSGNFVDTALGQPASSDWKVAGTFGDLDLRTLSVAALDAVSAHAEGHYQKLVIRLNREQTLIGNLSFYAAGTAQRADNNLDSSEQFFLGGPNGIRAYPVGEAPGDEGWQGTLEFRYRVARPVQLLVFHDLGMVEANHSPYINQANGRHLSGSGFGLNGNWSSYSVKTGLAWRGGSDAPTSDGDKRPRFWLQAGYSF